MVAGGLVSWETKRQDTIVLFTVEAEFMVFSWVTTQAIWISKYFGEINIPITKPVLINADNNGAISNSTNYKNHCQIKHIDVQHYFIKEWVNANEVTFWYIPSSENAVNFLTKPLPRDILCRIIEVLNLRTETPNAIVQRKYWAELLYFG